jgi:maleate cis-trans isomerase
MFESYVPKHKIGYLAPLSVIDYSAYEFQRLAPPGVMALTIPIGLTEFSGQDTARVFSSLDDHLDKLMERGADLILQSGTPLALLMGIDGHDRMIEHMARHTGVPATSTVLAVVRAARELGLRRVALANKWSAKMNDTLAEFFQRDGITVCGAATDEQSPADFIKIDAAAHMALSYKLGCQAFRDYPDCDTIYIGGGAWLTEPVVRRLEEDFAKPAISNLTATVRDVLQLLNDWHPIHGQSKVLSVA